MGPKFALLTRVCMLNFKVSYIFLIFSKLPWYECQQKGLQKVYFHWIISDKPITAWAKKLYFGDLQVAVVCLADL